MRLRRAICAAGVGAALLTPAILPSAAYAQRRAVVRVAPRRPVVVRSYYQRPLFFDGWFGFGYPWYPGGYYAYQRPYYYDLSGSLRVQVSPRETEVFVDGYYAGTVDDFDGVFQRLNIEPGDHDIELYLPGHRTLQQKVYLQPGKTARIRHVMEPLAAGDPEPVRPSASQRPQNDQAPRPGPARQRPSNRRDPRDDTRPDDAARDRDASYGSLSIRVQPADATVLIDGERWEGPQPGERLVVDLSAGRHVIEIQKDGFRRYTTEVTVRSGETAPLNVSLTAQ